MRGITHAGDYLVYSAVAAGPVDVVRSSLPYANGQTSRTTAPIITQVYASAPATSRTSDDEFLAASDQPDPGPQRPGLLRRSIGPVVTGLLSIAALVQAMRLWEWRPGTPLGLNGDNASVTVWVRSIIEFGPYANNPNLGAPFGQNLGWFPTGDDVHFLILWLLGRAFQDAFTVTAIYFFIGFPLAGLTMYWLARTERLSVVASITVGVLFAALPGHQVRFAHLFLAAYWVVPLGAWLALRLFRGQSVFRAGPGDEWGNERPRLWTLRTGAILVVVGLGGVYYTVFALILICAALVLRLVGEYRREHLYRGLAVIAVVACTDRPRACWGCTRGRWVIGRRSVHLWRDLQRSPGSSGARSSIWCFRRRMTAWWLWATSLVHTTRQPNRRSNRPRWGSSR